MQVFDRTFRFSRRQEMAHVFLQVTKVPIILARDRFKTAFQYFDSGRDHRIRQRLFGFHWRYDQAHAVCSAGP